MERIEVKGVWETAVRIRLEIAIVKLVKSIKSRIK